MPDKQDEPLYVEIMGGVLLPFERAARLYEWLIQDDGALFRTVLTVAQKSRIEAVWNNVAKTLPEIDRERGRSWALDEVISLSTSIKTAMTSPLTRHQAEESGYILNT